MMKSVLKKGVLQSVLAMTIGFAAPSAFAEVLDQDFFDLPHARGMSRLVCAKEGFGMMALDLKKSALTHRQSTVFGVKYKKLADIKDSYVEGTQENTKIVVLTEDFEKLEFSVESKSYLSDDEKETYRVSLEANQLVNASLKNALSGARCTLTVLFSK